VGRRLDERDLRRVCPDATTSYWVNVTDTGITGELPTPPQTVRAALTADVLTCPDAATSSCGGGAGPGIPASGLYAGTFYCPPGSDGGIVALPGSDGGLITGDFWVDLSVDPSLNQVTGMLYGKWVVLGVIAFQAGLQGTLDCSAGGGSGQLAERRMGPSRTGTGRRQCSTDGRARGHGARLADRVRGRRIPRGDRRHPHLVPVQLRQRKHVHRDVQRDAGAVTWRHAPRV
jgi:hypothetical protein